MNGRDAVHQWSKSSGTKEELRSDPRSSLPPLKKRHERKTFATPTLKIINSRLQYYRKVLKQPDPLTDKAKPQRQDEKRLAQRARIQQKYDHCMKVRQLLNNAVRNLYL